MNSSLCLNVVSKNKVNSLWFIFYKDKLLVKLENDKVRIPTFNDLYWLDLPRFKKQALGKLEDKPCYFVELQNEETIGKDMVFLDLRDLLDHIDYNTFFLAGKASQIIDFNKNNKYCGKCGQPTKIRPNKHSRICSSCGLIVYPKISPAIIVAITKGDKILLARNSKFKSNYYSVLAGFVDLGETLEDCVKREVMEEVGIKIKNIEYFKSQPWPFPDALMIGFTAEYHSGEIFVDDKELSEAKWFSANNMPDVPGPMSLSRKLIDYFIESRRGDG